MKCTITSISFTDSVVQWSGLRAQHCTRLENLLMVGNRNSRQTPLVMKKHTLLSKSWIILGTSYRWTHTLCFFCDWVLLIKKLFSNEFSAHSSDHCTKFFARNLPCVSLLCNFSIWCICMSVYMSEHTWSSGDSLQAPVLSAVSIPGIELRSSGLLADVFSAFVSLRVTCMFSAFVFLHANHSALVWSSFIYPI